MAGVWRLYDRFAAAYDRDRSRGTMERGWLDAVATRLPKGARVLDLGCGVGEPIARYFTASGCAVTGIDAAPSMIAICRGRLPEGTWIVADMRGLDLGPRFDAVVAWDSFFHLAAGDQRAMFAVFARHAAAGCLLLFTSGPAAGEAIGDLYGEPLPHASLAPEEYERLLADAGFAVLRYRSEDPECGGHAVWLAQSVRLGPATPR